MESLMKNLFRISIILLQTVLKLFLGVVLGCWFITDSIVVIGVNQYLLYLYIFINFLCIISFFASFFPKIQKCSYIVFVFGLMFYGLLNFIPQISSRFARDACYDDGSVWDDKENRCRSDCLLISKTHGCIEMTKEHQILFEQCAKNPIQCDRKTERVYYVNLCKKYNLAINPETKLCDFQ